jgi:hypothetical protein
LRARRTIAGAFAFVSGAASELVIPSATRRIRSPGAGGARFDDCSPSEGVGNRSERLSARLISAPGGLPRFSWERHTRL